MKRAFVIVLDSLGVGTLPDAADFRDAGAHTLDHRVAAADSLSQALLGGSVLVGDPPVRLPLVHGRVQPSPPRGLRAVVSGAWSSCPR